MFKFNFDIDADDRDSHPFENANAPTVETKPTSVSQDFQEHYLDDLISDLPDLISYSPISVPLASGGALTLVRRDLYDARFQLISDEKGDNGDSGAAGAAGSCGERNDMEPNEPLAHVNHDLSPTTAHQSHSKGDALKYIDSPSDLVPGVYEGGLKTWECSLDLVDYLHDTPVASRGMSCLEVGCGTGMPSIYLLRQLSAKVLDASTQDTQTHVHLQDFNSSVLRLVTLPNMLLNWYMSTASKDFQPTDTSDVTFPPRDSTIPGELPITDELKHAFLDYHKRANISIRFFSGSWESFDLQRPYDLLLTSETIYRMDSLPSLIALMRNACRSAEGTCLVAAKVLYFGVGGGVSEFARQVEGAGKVSTVRENKVGADSLASTPHEELPPPVLPIAQAQLSTSSTGTTGVAPDDEKEEGEIDETPTPPSVPQRLPGKPLDEARSEPKSSSGPAPPLPLLEATSRITSSSGPPRDQKDEGKSLIPSEAVRTEKTTDTGNENVVRKITTTPTWDTEPTPRTPVNLRAMPPSTKLAMPSASTAANADAEMDDDVILTPSKTLSPLHKPTEALSGDVKLSRDVGQEKESTPTAVTAGVTISTPTELQGDVKVLDETTDGGNEEVKVPVMSGENVVAVGSSSVSGRHDVPSTDVDMDAPPVQTFSPATDSFKNLQAPSTTLLEDSVLPVSTPVTREEQPPSHLQTTTTSPLNDDTLPRSSTPGVVDPPRRSPQPQDGQDMVNQGFLPDTGDDNQAMDRPLNVSDALSYLDDVKVQFTDKPNVYNKFLDIMKEFKGQMIDTPGVIRRVTHLFDGHPTLIQGFNTFLPTGYRIECSFGQGDERGDYPGGGDHDDDHPSRGFLTVTTPNGVTRHRMGNLGAMNLGTVREEPLGPGMERQGMLFGPGVGGPGLGGPGTPLGYETSHPHNAEFGGPSIGASGPGEAGLQSEAIEPAVQYVQKIKQRCDAETYKQFLDILGRYHSSPGIMDEREVSVQISQLFKDAPDLRSDFRIFMPPKTQQMLDDEGFYSGDFGPERDGKGKRKPLEPASSTGSLPARKRRKGAERERENIAISKPTSGRSKHPTSQYDLATKYSGRMSPPPAARHSSQHQPPPLNQPPLSSVRSSGPVALPMHVGYTHSHSLQPPNIPDANEFFAAVKRSLDSRETYHEFLKVINLFTQGYIDTSRLIKEAATYLGDGGDGGVLLIALKTLLDWDDKKDREMWNGYVNAHVVGVGMTGGGKGSGSVEWARPVVVERVGEASKRLMPGRVDLSVQYGSYRKLPISDINSTCSGRDEMCRSVLNDEWVSHPTYASEDSGSPIFKKNVYEEALHRSEEERHEYDFHIDAISKMISLLEPINNKILSLSLEERHNFKLKPNLGGSAKSIHFRVVKKIYGRDTGLEVIQSMQDSPGLAIPIVFARLKQKEEEWKRAQREWNKVWREVDARNYQKSLDYQSTNFKTNDKKALTTKALVNQIEAAREEQMSKRASLIDPLFNRTRCRHQMEFVVDDVKVLQDTLKLVFSFLDRMQAQIAFAERRKIERFLRSFVVLFFGLDAASFNSAFVVVGEASANGVNGDGGSEGSDEVTSVVDDVEVASTASGHSSRTGGGRGRKNGAGSTSDLRKKLLKNEQAKSGRKAKGTHSSASTPAGSRRASPIADDATANLLDGSTGRKNVGKGIFFSNTAFYVLIRLLEASPNVATLLDMLIAFVL
ncbi:hypothetical protein ONZ45_g13590 [Pleurotus djamor]|nr:hypothetical protein ONZ45_g13590 [Pleurotus djamor]